MHHVAFVEGKRRSRIFWTRSSDDSETLVEVAGVEPASRDSSETASTHVVSLMFLSSVQEGTPTEPRLPSTV